MDYNCCNNQKTTCPYREGEDETFALIEARTLKDADFKKKNCQYPVIWTEIQSSTPALSNRTTQECIKKWKNLLDTFKKLKDPKTGTAPTTTNAGNWVYFSKLNDLMAAKHTIVPNIFESTTYTRCRTLSNTSDDFIVYESESANEVSEIGITLPGTSQNNESTRKKPKTPVQQQILNHIKERDQQIVKSIKKNNKMMRAVCHKYFPDVELSSDSD